MDNKSYKKGLKKALDLLNDIDRYDLNWEQMDKHEHGSYVGFWDIKNAIINELNDK